MDALDALYSAGASDEQPDTLETLLKAVRDRARAYNRRFGDKAEDIAQDVALIVFRKLGAFTPQSESSFSFWLSTIMRRERLSRYDDHPHFSSAALPEHEQPEYDRYVDISCLPPFMKEAAAYFLLGHTIEETAALMNLKPGTLRKRLHAYRKQVTKPSPQPVYR